MFGASDSRGGVTVPERTAALKKAQQKYMEKFSVARVRMERDRYEKIQTHAATRGESANAFINRAIDNQMKLDSAGRPQEAAESTQGVGMVSFPETLDAAQMAAEATGEAMGEFLARAVETQAQRDRSSMAMGINPATGDKMKGEA